MISWFQGFCASSLGECAHFEQNTWSILGDVANITTFYYY